MSIDENSNKLINYLLLENLKFFCEILLIISRMFQNFCLILIKVILHYLFKLELNSLQNNTNSPGGTTSIGKIQTPISAGSESTSKLENSFGNGKFHQSPSKSETKRSLQHNKPHDYFRNALLIGEFFVLFYVS